MDRAEKIRRIPLHERALIDEDVAACLCSVSRKVFRSWVRAGFISPVALPTQSNRKLYSREDLLSRIREMRRGPVWHLV